MTELQSGHLVWLIPALPLAGFLLHAFLGQWIVKTAGAANGRRVVGGIATGVVLASFAISILVLLELLRVPVEERRSVVGLVPGGIKAPWISIGNFSAGFVGLVDPLSMLMCLIVTGVGGLIHLYATGYMAEDRDYPRFFTYFNLFIFSMLMLVLGGNLVLMFVGWEGVGLCSYLLISFWFEETDNAKAGNKAFIVNRIGDVGFALGMMAIFYTFGTLDYRSAAGTGVLDLAAKGLTQSGPLTAGVATTIALLLFVGACGKSAQFPLYIWLPDAMAGPTPVSALIHAATMVTAGVVMVTRMGSIFAQSPVAMAVVAGIGLFTAFYAATIALTQTDIKKVLAYSTVSQLGYMFLGCGAGAFAAGMFHVTTHAFFKALLFLGAGSVIHSLSGQQDMRKMGGLARQIKWTHGTMVAGWLAICGFPLLAGFWSKDAVLGFAAGVPGLGPWYYGIGLVTAAMTATYMTRLMAKTFWSPSRQVMGSHGHGDHGGHGQPHESPPCMILPLVVLAALSVVGGLIGTPWANYFERFLEPSLPPASILHAHEGVEPMVGMMIGGAVAIVAMVATLFAYRGKASGDLLPEAARTGNPLVVGSTNLWYVDALFTWIGVRFGGLFANFVWKKVDAAVVDGAVNGVAGAMGVTGDVLRRGQTGAARWYVVTMLGGTVAVLIGLVWEFMAR